jgi:hypothetical protein
MWNENNPRRSCGEKLLTSFLSIVEAFSLMEFRMKAKAEEFSDIIDHLKTLRTQKNLDKELSKGILERAKIFLEI